MQITAYPGFDWKDDFEMIHLHTLARSQNQ